MVMSSEGGSSILLMRKSTKLFVAGVALTALAAIASLAFWRPEVSGSELSALAFLFALAVGAEMLAFVLPRKVRGSMAFIPYLATIVIVPSWLAPGSIMVVKLLFEIAGGNDKRKAVFNASAHAINIAAGVYVFVMLGGTSWLTLQELSLAAASREFGFAAFFAFLTSFSVQMALLTGVVSLESDDPIAAVVRDVSLPTLGIDLLTTPVVFVFAWVYTSIGAMAAGVIWVPLVGIRHVTKVNLELETANQELLQLMVKSIEARDPYTSGHSRRVSRYAVAIARALGLSEREVTSISTAALLHDVGKIYEKYAPILTNPGRLSPSEWATMQEHPVDGANLVATISRLSDLVPAIRHHHENWDGSGYPDRISGDSIPLASRIIMFADTIDAMTSERPYRSALSEEEVRAEIVRGRGRQFDPSIADRLLAVGIWRAIFGEAKSGSRKVALVSDRETA